MTLGHATNHRTDGENVRKMQMKFGGIMTTAFALRAARKRSKGGRPTPTMWEKVNINRYYTFRVRVQNLLSSADAWWDRHPIIVGLLSATVIVAGVMAMVNLELGRPWF